MAISTEGSPNESSAGGGAPLALNIHLLNHTLADSELLLSYAVDTGVMVDAAVLRGILEARAAARNGWTEQAAANLLTASATLASVLKPVSAESLRNTESYRSKSRGRRLLLPLTMGLLATLIVFYSATAFLFSGLSAKILGNLNVATPLAVKLISELGAAPSPNPKLCLNSVTPTLAAQAAPGLSPGINRKDVIDDLQQFAAAIRDMYGDARRMSRLYHGLSTSTQPPENIFDFSSPPTSKELTEMLELPPGLPDLVQAATERVCVYQRARYYAQSTEEDATILTGAVAASILPVLYALLGAGAYVLRRLESQLRSRTFISEAHSPRFITAAIAGAVVGLFNFGQGVSVSPLAIAFLVGYAVDVFFTFLESLIEALSRAREKDASGKAKT